MQAAQLRAIVVIGSIMATTTPYVINSPALRQDYITSLDIYEGSVICHAELKGSDSGPELGIQVWLTDPDGTTIKTKEDWTYSINLEVEFAVEPPVSGNYTCNAIYSVNGSTIDQLQVSQNITLCAQPVRFRKKQGFPGSNGALFFEYEWDSSSGNLQDLSSCRVGERITYSPWPFPRPPFRESPPNNLIKTVPASDGGLYDEHITAQPFLQPYSQVSVRGDQDYQHDCRCKLFDPEWFILDTPIPPLYRTIEPNGDGTWRFTASKSFVVSTVSPLPQ